MISTRDEGVQAELKKDESRKRKRTELETLNEGVKQASNRGKLEDDKREKRALKMRASREQFFESKQNPKEDTGSQEPKLKKQKATPRPKPVRLVDYVMNPIAGFSQIQHVRYSPHVKEFCWFTEKPVSIQTNLNGRYIKHIDNRRISHGKYDTKASNSAGKKNEFRKNFKDFDLLIRGREQAFFLLQDAKIAASNPFFQKPNESYGIEDSFFKFYFPLDKFPKKEEIEEFKKPYSLNKEEDNIASKAYRIVTNPRNPKPLVGARPKPKKIPKKTTCLRDKDEVEFSDPDSDFVVSSKSREDKMDTSNNSSNNSSNAKTEKTAPEKTADSTRKVQIVLKKSGKKVADALALTARPMETGETKPLIHYSVFTHNNNNDEFYHKRKFLWQIVGPTNKCQSVYNYQGYQLVDFFVDAKEFQKKADRFQLNIAFERFSDVPEKLVLFCKKGHDVIRTPQSSQEALEKLKKLNKELDAKASAEAAEVLAADRARMDIRVR